MANTERLGQLRENLTEDFDLDELRSLCFDLACSRLTRNLTKEEWKQYLPDEVYRKTCPNLPDGE